MKRITGIFTLLWLSVCTLHSQESDAGNFPDDYFGIYTGTLKINSSGGLSTYPMEFHLLATDSIGVYEYKLVYGKGDQRQVRAYNLIAQNKDQGEYIVDENNGIILDDKVVGNRMYALFEVGGSLLTTFITFEKDHMVFEIVATQKENKRITYAENEEKTEVISYPITTVQRAVLQKH
ncbi:MAG: hypothetical protein AAFP76_09030 [Bacteroidota bacterium]